jgi:hypothetical protein
VVFQKYHTRPAFKLWRIFAIWRNYFRKNNILSNIPFLNRQKNLKSKKSPCFKQGNQDLNFFDKFLLSLLVYSQMWLNFLVDDRQCGNMTNLEKKHCTRPTLVRPMVLGDMFLAQNNSGK